MLFVRRIRENPFHHGIAARLEGLPVGVNTLVRQEGGHIRIEELVVLCRIGKNDSRVWERHFIVFRVAIRALARRLAHDRRLSPFLEVDSVPQRGRESPATGDDRSEERRVGKECRL